MTFVEQLGVELSQRELEIYEGRAGLSEEQRVRYLNIFKRRGQPKPIRAQQLPRPKPQPKEGGCGCGGKRRKGLLNQDQLTVNLGAGGIGDALLASCAVRGLAADHPMKKIVYRVSALAMPFVELFDAGYCELKIHDHDQNRNEPPNLTDLQLNLGYNLDEVKKKAPVPRWVRYQKNCRASACRLPDLRDRSALIEKGKDFKDCVVCCPFASYVDRELSARNWSDHIHKLQYHGYRVIVLAATPDRTEIFQNVEKVIGEPADVVAGIMLNSLVTVGGDSGLCHLSGIMGVPTVVLCGQTTGKDIFGFYPRVRCLQGHLRCDGCWWQEPYHSSTCNPYCPNLATISSTEVLRAVDDFALFDMSAGRACVVPEKLSVLRDGMMETDGLDGDVAEFGVWRGGSAAVLKRYSTHGKLHLFDTFQGIPSDDVHDGEKHLAGDFGDTSLEDVQRFLPDAEYHVGCFPDTAVEGLRLRFAHCDMDTYESTLAVCHYLNKVMQPFSRAVFDDAGWPKTPGVMKAIHEVFGLDRWERKSEYQVSIKF